MREAPNMDYRLVFSTLNETCNQTLASLSDTEDLPYGEVGERLAVCIRQIQAHGAALEPVVASFTNVYHHYDFDEETPGNGYRTLVKVLLSCLLHIIHKARYISSNLRGAFFRADHNATEMEAYLSALCQLRALLHLAQTLLNDTPCGQLCTLQDAELSRRFVQEYSSMHKACFYGRCLGFQFSPSLRPFLQTVVISMVSYGETYGKQQSGIGKAALSLLTSGKYVMDPEMRGAEFERITQNLDLQFWKSFWNLTETGLITGFNRIASNPVQVNLTLSVPPMTLQLPLASDPSLSTNVSPPIAHWGPGPVLMRLISFEIREGQDSEELLSFSRTETRPMSMSQLPWVQKQPLSPWLLIHFHGGGFVAQTSKSHENYLRNWSKELGVPVLSIDYSLSPEAPFPRALEECFYGYCWALKNCHLLGSTAERVCLAGDSAGGNLCITVSMKAVSCGVRVPDGIMAAYPATLLTTDASPSRLLTSIDPLLPLGVLAKCLNAYTGMGSEAVQPAVGQGSLSSLSRDTVLVLSDLTHSASNWIQSFLDPKRTIDRPSPQPPAPPLLNSTPLASTPNRSGCSDAVEYPEGFEPLRSKCFAVVHPTSGPILKNPFASPLLASEQLLRGLPPVHIVASALDALLDDSVMFAKKLRAMGQPVSLSVVEDLPHGFLSLSQLSKETEEATRVCVQRIREVFQGPNCTTILENSPQQEGTQQSTGQ
ncbi:lipase, hormone-sensitive a [Periophthalmus magnuspinnatus]|uniref:lipase, hormone-sensitive a n=1 Tax=Periophthalmus magnuspinnatus TaxID=409849 RepID=UPI00145BAD7C|nr:lipase, hormone-sensitive a [Periophthalmus magnuspinnatus]